MTMAPSSLLSAMTALATTLVLLHHSIHASAATSASSPVQCQSGWTSSLQTLAPSQINDGYCDCPLDGSDEPNTGACSGSTVGMWAGIESATVASSSSSSPLSFACPQQPSLRLPPSRVSDGVCDCCDGADEAAGGAGVGCRDVCDETLAEERALRARLRSNYELGSKRRLDSVERYREWRGERGGELERLRESDFPDAEFRAREADRELREVKVALAREWTRRAAMNDAMEEVSGREEEEGPLRDLVGSDSGMGADDLASFVLSLCALSAELSSGNIANGRCLPLDRASLDVGILWNYDDDDGDDLPSFEYLDPGSDDALLDYAEKIMLRLEGKDTNSSSSRGRNNNKDKKSKSPPPEYDSEDSEDDPYGDDWEDRHEYQDSEDDHYEWEGDHSEEDSVTEEKENDDQEEPELTPNELLVKLLLDSVPIDRTLFKEQSKCLLDFTLGSLDDADEGTEVEELTASDIINADVDPMALQMTKAAVSKRLSNISLGETSARSAARFVAALMQATDSSLKNLRKLAISTAYHCDVAAGDIAELVYSVSSHFGATGETSSDGGGEASCTPPWSAMCPPRTVRSGDKTYPPAFLVEAATRRCGAREGAAGVCAVPGEGGVVDFPTTVPDGYFNYYEPQSREKSADDELVPYFSSVESLHAEMPSNLSDLRKRKETLDKQKNSLSKRVADLNNEIGDDSKFGTDGELYLLRDECHKVESGKYEYEVCIFGKATQRDAGQKSGGTNLGTWKDVDVDEVGRRTLRWGGGTKCWNGPVRSAEVTVTCGAETKLLTATEPDTCRYVFTMESPIGCDERFKLENHL